MTLNRKDMKRVMMMVILVSAFIFTNAQTKTIYTCPMHPEVQMSKPGNCPKCGMTLVKKTIKVAAPKKTSSQKKTTTPSKTPVQKQPVSKDTIPATASDTTDVKQMMKEMREMMQEMRDMMKDMKGKMQNGNTQNDATNSDTTAMINKTVY